ncbi:hypothetical protein ERJ75_001062200 [Trypanosoma vivax]|nr:hypothetical protein ERJ75_001062200 [Trypanosoma vivax]
MDILRRVTVVKLSRLPDVIGETVRDTVVSWQPLRFSLTVTSSCGEDNTIRSGMALNALFGECDFVRIWTKLFHTLQVTPVIMRESAAPPRDTDGDETFVFGAPPYWGCVEDDAESKGSNAEKPWGGKRVSTGKSFILNADNGPNRADTGAQTPEVPTGSAKEEREGVGGGVPRCVRFEYKFDYVLPDLSEFCEGERICLGFVLMPVSSSSGNEGASAHDGVDTDECNGELIRALVPKEGRVKAWFGSPCVVFGACYYRACARRLLDCSSVTRCVASLHTLAIITVSNKSSVLVQIEQVLFDLFSTRVRDDKDEAICSGLRPDQRLGSCGVNMKTLGLVQRTVVANLVLSDSDHMPVMLRPGECFNFQVAIEVLPYFCYLFESSSAVQEVSTDRVVSCFGSGRSDMGHRMKQCGSPTSPSSVPSSIVASRFDTAFLPTAIKGTVAELVAEFGSTSELRRAVASPFTSHTYVFYRILTGEDSGGAPAGVPPLQCRHAVHWSVAVP